MANELKPNKMMKRYYNLPVSLISTSSTSSEGLIFRASDNLKRVVKVGCRRPRSSKEMYVLSRSQNSASFSWESFLFSRNSRKTVPNMLTIIIPTLVSIKIKHNSGLNYGLQSEITIFEKQSN